MLHSSEVWDACGLLFFLTAISLKARIWLASLENAYKNPNGFVYTERLKVFAFSFQVHLKKAEVETGGDSSI